MAEQKGTAPASDFTPTVPVAEALLKPEARLHRAETITRDHVLMATAVGFVPGPGLDLAGSFAVQLALLGRLSKLYGVPYTENAGKAAVFSLAGSLGGLGAGSLLAMSVVKSVPLIGTAIGVLSMPVMMGAFTYATGKVFTQHFESGGTFLDFDAGSYRQYFREMFRRGKTLARETSQVSAGGKTAMATPTAAAV